MKPSLSTSCRRTTLINLVIPRRPRTAPQLLRKASIFLLALGSSEMLLRRRAGRSSSAETAAEIKATAESHILLMNYKSCVGVLSLICVLLWYSHSIVEVVNESSTPSKYCAAVALYQDSQPPIPVKVLYSDYKRGILGYKALVNQGWEDPMRKKSRPKGKNPFKLASPKVTMFFLKATAMHNRIKFPHDFPCKGQMYNHIYGDEALGHKSKVVDSLREYEESLKLSKPRCEFTLVDVHPESYNLHHKDQCITYLQVASSEPITNNVTWILKISENSHNAQGLTLIRDTSVISDMVECDGNDPRMAQRYLPNPLLLNGHKADLRVYILIASTSPLIAYSGPGFVRRSLTPYNSSSKELASHITNTQLSKAIKGFKKNTTLQNEQFWNFHRLAGYLEDSGLVDNGDLWLRDTLEVQLRVAMIHLMNSVQRKLDPRPGLFSLYGLDFILDDRLKLWFIEANRSPSLEGSSSEKSEIVNTLIEDVSNIQYHLLYNSPESLLSDTGIPSFPLKTLKPIIHSSHGFYHQDFPRECV